MKNSILTILAVVALVSCKKSETTSVNNSSDSTLAMAPNDAAVIPADSTTLPASKTKAPMLSDQDKNFAEGAAKGGMMEVMLGKIAETNSSNEKIKAFGKMMVDDHTKANDELKSWASMANYSLPSGLSADQQKKVDDLKMKKGMDFDKAYTALMVSDHRADIAEFKKEASSGTEASLKLFASKIIPTLEHHLAKVEEAMKAVK